MRRNWLIPVPLLGAITVPTLGGPTVYVDDSAVGSNDGTSWIDAFIDLQDALDFAVAHPEDDFEIWVAAGTYKPDRGTGDKFASFGMLSNVALLGGFAGWEWECDQRDPAANETILQGDLLDNDNSGFTPTSNCCSSRLSPGCDNDECESRVCAVAPFCCIRWSTDCVYFADELCCDLCEADRCDNSSHVVVAHDVSSGAMLDGFTVTGGNAKHISIENHRGGGLLIEGGAPTIENCVFSQNEAYLGGGIASLTNALPTITQTTFIENEAGGGGGMYAYEDGGALIRHCVFRENRGNRGVALRTIYSSPIIMDTVFEKNQPPHGDIDLPGPTAVAISEGDAFFSGCQFRGHSETFVLGCGGPTTTLIDCVFEYNLLGVFSADDFLTMERCTFSNNSGPDRGVAMYFGNGNARLYDCVFVNNHASVWNGGAIYLGFDATLEATRCSFRGNRSRLGGAAVFLLNSCAAKFVDSTFENNVNYGVNGGGGIYLAGKDSSVIVERSAFLRNRSVSSGSAIKVDDGAATIRDSLFVGNEGSASALSTISRFASANVERSLFYGNSAGFFGGAIYNGGGSTTLRNSILWANRGEDSRTEDGQLHTDSDGTLVIDYTNIEGWTGALGGVGNTGDDPLFVDPIGPDGLEGTGDENFRLSPDSPLINTGDPTYVPQSEDADLDGHARILCDRVDMGAYEFGIGDFNCDRILELADFASWPSCLTGPPDSPDHPEPYPADCEAYDFHAEVDDRIDLLDFAGLQNHFMTP